MYAEFSERAYELAINMELLRGSAEWFVPSQNEEGELGFDIWLVPALEAMWSLFGRDPHPRALDPKVGRQLFATSLFLQYKCPEFMMQGTAKEAEARRTKFGEIGLPYFRYPVEPKQLKLLLNKASEMSGEAQVCYAAPAFHENEQFFKRREEGTVFKNSNFVTAGRIEKGLVDVGDDPSDPDGHVFTYAVEFGRELLCSEPASIEGMDGEGLRQNLRRRIFTGSEPLIEHIEGLADALRGKDDSELRPPMSFPQTQKSPIYEPWRPPSEPLSAAFEIHRAIQGLGFGWHLAMLPEKRLD